MKKVIVLILFLFSSVSFAACHRHHDGHHCKYRHYGYGYTNYYYAPGPYYRSEYRPYYRHHHRYYYAPARYYYRDNNDPRVYYRPYRGSPAYYYYGEYRYRPRAEF